VMVKQNKLDNGQIERIVVSLRLLERFHLGLAETLQREANYFEQNKERMRYPKFRKQGFFVGSGVIEAGCNAECIVTLSCAAEEPPIPIVSWMIC